MSFSITGHTRLFGVIGDPVHHSLSPLMHNHAFASLGLNGCYLPFHVSPIHLFTALKGFQAIGVEGFNATIPHKEALVPLMDELDPMASMIGAVNTVRIGKDGRLHGFNTDVYGFKTALQECFPIPLDNIPIWVLGAGGAARGVLAGLLQLGAKEINLVNRTHARAVDLAEQFYKFFPDSLVIPRAWSSGLKMESPLLINTTSLGLGGDDGIELDLSGLPESALVYDIVYAPPVTPLLAAAKARGLAVENGLGMLLHQGAQAFELWTGHKMPVDSVKTLLMAKIKGDSCP